MSRRQHRSTGRNREIGLVQKRGPCNESPRSEGPCSERRELDLVFESLKKTVAVAQNQDSEWQLERKDIAMLLEMIREKRNFLAFLMYTSDSAEEKLDLYTFLLNQNSQSVALEEYTSKHYALDAYVQPFKSPFTL